MLGSIYQANGFRVDSWYLDGFSPKLNPDMWAPDLFDKISLLSKQGTTLSTYSVAGDIRRGLIQAGFSVFKEEGFGKKRHMLSASFVSQATQEQNNLKPWFSLPKPTPSNQKTVTVIGAGLAGCSTAYSLANKGWQVNLIERQPEIASMASGNPQGIVHFKIAKQSNPINDFNQQAFLYAVKQYQYLNKEFNFNWHQCGMIKLAFDASEEQKQKDILLNNSYSDRVLSPLSSKQASSVAGIPLTMGGLFFPGSAYLNPQLLCKAYTQHPLITTHLQTEAIELSRTSEEWEISTQASTGNKELLTTSNVVIIANSFDANKISASQHYPLIPNKGQVDFYTSTKQSQDLKTVLCTNAYITPALENQHSLGGSFTPDSFDTDLCLETKNENLALLESFLPAISKSFRVQKQLNSRAATRCSSPDFQPIVGPVEDLARNQAIYKSLSLNAKKLINIPPSYEENLYINVGHGSHALTTSPLTAEYLAALINKEALPIQNEIVHSLHPLRFLIRNLKRQKK